MSIAKYKYAVCCSSNQNRSMDAHAYLKAKGITDIASYGSGSQVKLPGPSATSPNIYEFGIPYDQMYKDLSESDFELYTR